MSLRTGTEMICLSLLFNKIAGFYGLLAILTGFKLDAMQLSLYLYSVAALILVALLMPHIRRQSPFECLVLAWFYFFDTIINCAYTAGFAFTWFMAVSASSPNTEGGVPSGAPGSGTINDTAGFTSPKYKVSEVGVVASPGTNLDGSQDAAAIGLAAVTTAVTENTGLQHGVQMVESIPSLVIIVLLTLIRVYFVLIMLAYARQVIQQYRYTASPARANILTGGSAEDGVFDSSMSQTPGWKAKLGRIMVWPAREYFLGGPVDDDWAKGVNSRFTSVPNEPRGTFERERRARSGTGPPRPTVDLGKLEA
jgi:hypothetical protein